MPNSACQCASGRGGSEGAGKLEGGRVIFVLFWATAFCMRINWQNSNDWPYSLLFECARVCLCVLWYMCVCVCVCVRVYVDVPMLVGVWSVVEWFPGNLSLSHETALPWASVFVFGSSFVPWPHIQKHCVRLAFLFSQLVLLSYCRLFGLVYPAFFYRVFRSSSYCAVFVVYRPCSVPFNSSTPLLSIVCWLCSMASIVSHT